MPVVERRRTLRLPASALAEIVALAHVRANDPPRSRSVSTPAAS